MKTVDRAIWRKDLVKGQTVDGRFPEWKAMSRGGETKGNEGKESQSFDGDIVR